MNIKLDPEFRSLMPAPSAEEKAQLEANLVAGGMRDPLVLWNDTLIDGYTRYEIAQRLRLTYQTVEIELQDRDAAIYWIIGNQLGRRNLQPYARAELALKLERVIQKQAKQKQRDAGGAIVQKSTEPPISTREELVKMSGLSHDTIRKAKIIAAKAPEDVKGKLRSGETTINKEFQVIARPTKHKIKPPPLTEYEKAVMNNIAGTFETMGCSDVVTRSGQTRSITGMPRQSVNADTGELINTGSRVGGGGKKMYGLDRIPESPIEIARAIRRGHGALFDRVLSTVQQAAPETIVEAIDVTEPSTVPQPEEQHCDVPGCDAPAFIHVKRCAMHAPEDATSSGNPWKQYAHHMAAAKLLLKSIPHEKVLDAVGKTTAMRNAWTKFCEVELIAHGLVNEAVSIMVGDDAVLVEENGEPTIEVQPELSTKPKPLASKKYRAKGKGSNGE